MREGLPGSCSLVHAAQKSLGARMHYSLGGGALRVLGGFHVGETGCGVSNIQITTKRVIKMLLLEYGIPF